MKAIPVGKLPFSARKKKLAKIPDLTSSGIQHPQLSRTSHSSTRTSVAGRQTRSENWQLCHHPSRSRRASPAPWLGSSACMWSLLEQGRSLRASPGRPARRPRLALSGHAFWRVVDTSPSSASRYGAQAGLHRNACSDVSVSDRWVIWNCKDFICCHDQPLLFSQPSLLVLGDVNMSCPL